jgi:hypothetical protein
MDEIERFGFIPNGGRIYCAFLSFPFELYGTNARVSQT